MSEAGYVNFYEILGLAVGANPGEVRKTYRKKMKDLVMEIHQAALTADRRSFYLLEMAKLNAALYTLRDQEKREEYWNERNELVALEAQWRDIPENDSEQSDTLRRLFDGKVCRFLSVYVEEGMLEAGRDKECVEASNWDNAHERHASNILRHYRHRLYQDILERLPFYEVTRPSVDWDERARTAGLIITERAS